MDLTYPWMLHVFVFVISGRAYRGSEPWKVRNAFYTYQFLALLYVFIYASFTF